MKQEKELLPSARPNNLSSPLKCAGFFCFVPSQLLVVEKEMKIMFVTKAAQNMGVESVSSSMDDAVLSCCGWEGSRVS